MDLFHCINVTQPKAMAQNKCTDRKKLKLAATAALITVFLADSRSSAAPDYSSTELPNAAVAGKNF